MKYNGRQIKKEICAVVCSLLIYKGFAGCFICVDLCGLSGNGRRLCFDAVQLYADGKQMCADGIQTQVENGCCPVAEERALRRSLWRVVKSKI